MKQSILKEPPKKVEGLRFDYQSYRDEIRDTKIAKGSLWICGIFCFLVWLEDFIQTILSF